MNTPASVKIGALSGQMPGIPPQESERLAALRSLGLLDTPPSEPIERIAALAASVIDVPIALVSLIDDNRQWFTARVGLDVCATSREISFCAHAVYERQILNVPDATKDFRFAGNPMVTAAPHIRAYLGVPLYSRAGHALGTLCALDVRPRIFDANEVQTLRQFAKILEDSLHALEVAAATAAVLQLATEREALFRDTFEQAAVGIVHADLSGQLLRVNQRTCEMLGYTESEFYRLSLADISHPEDVSNNLELFRRMRAGENDTYHFENRFLRKDHSILWCHLSVAMKHSASGKRDYVITVIEDIAARKEAEARLIGARDTLQAEVTRQTLRLTAKNRELQTHIRKVLSSERSLRVVEHRLRSITNNVPAMIGYWNRELQCEFANNAYQELFRLQAKWTIGTSMRALLGDGHFSSIEPLAHLALAGEAQHFVRRTIKSDGSAAFVEVRFIPDFNETTHVRGFFVLAGDITEARNARIALEATNEKLARESATDYLTGLSNRRVFSERSEAALRRFRDAGEVYGLILMDLDNFKLVNDVHGHDVGDDVLRAVGGVLKDQLRCDRDIAARLGGEEFAILCFGDLDRDSLRLVAERVREQVAADGVPTPSGLLRFTGSFGIALCNVDDSGWKNIYARADAALYDAKAKGKNRVQFGRFHPPDAVGQVRTLKIVAAR